MEKEKLKSMPKVELHCHLDGSLSRSFISQELGREVDPTELQVAYGCRSLKEYLEKFDAGNTLRLSGRRAWHDQCALPVHF